MNQPDASGRPMYDATCAQCGNQTQVPFQPSGDRPVYCYNCFRDMRKNSPGGPSGGGGGGGPRGDRQMFDSKCSNCGAATQVPFRPTEGRPVYCNDCFRKMRA